MRSLTEGASRFVEYSCLNQNSKGDFDQKDNKNEGGSHESMAGNRNALFPASELPSHTNMPAMLL